MAVLRRRNEKQFLADIPTLITEEGIDSKYFQIFGIPEELPTGKSSFIVGGSPFLKSGVKLKIEIIDSKGEVIYTEPVFGYRDGVNRRVSIEIYDSSQVGEAIFTLLGEIDPAKSDVPIPTEWQGVYNVKYTRRLSINPTLLNVQPIRFHKQPYVNVVPLTNAFKEYIQQPEETRILTAELVSSKTAGTSAQTTDVVTQEQSYPEEDQAEKSFDFMSLYNSAAFRQSSFSNFRMPFTFQSFSPPTGNANLIVSSGSLDDGMIGKNIIINDPQVDTNSPNIPTNYTIPSQYSSSIIDITNDTTANLAKAFYVTGDDGSTKYPVNLSTNQTFTCSFSPIPTEQDSVINYFDLADIRLSRLRTFSGDVKYVRVFAISQGAQTEQQFDLLGEFPLESQELLFDYDNIKSGRTGFFFNQTKIDNYWNAFGGNRATTATGSYGLAQTGSFIRYAMDISGSNADLNQEIMAQTSQSFSLSKNVPYELSFKLYGSKTPKTTSTGDGNKARIDFLISGSDFKPNHEFGGTYGRRILSIDFDDSNGDIDLRKFKSYDWNKTYLSGMFIPLTSGLGKLQIRASSGRWHVADVSLRPAADTNFSPEIARIFSEMPPSRNRPETVKFLLEFVNNDGKKADAVIISPEVVFPGANFAIQGDNNVLSGSMFISNAVGEGIEMAGVGSAFLRTIGWEGFTSASSGTGKGGFFLYSGSVLSDSPDDYMGAGLEIHDGQSGSRERYFQFKTQHGASSESIFRVKTDDYLFGISGSGGVESYISGADGNLEVSSSNFSISNTGDVAMTGTITATAGNIGDWTISSGNIVGSNITMDADGSRIYKTDSNGELNGYYMDFTPGANYYVRFGTDFAVSSSGTLIASGAIIEGVITASEGYIANWTIAPNTINKLTGGTYTGMSSTGDARFFAGAANLNAGTSSAVFNVKSGGDVTGSQVLFTGGKIGGFTIDADEIKSTNLLLDSTNEKITVGSANAVTIQGGGTDNFITMGKTTFGQTTTVGAILGMDAAVPTLELFKDANNKFIFNNSGVEIKSQVFDLATPTMLLDSGTNSGKISLGATPPTAYNSGTGIYIDGTGKLLIGNSGGDRIQFDGSNFTIQVGTLDINATDIEISSTQASASFGHDTDVGTLVIEGAPARITVVSGSISNTTFQGNTAAGGYHGEILKIGDITDNDGGDKFGLMMFDGKGIDVEDNRILSLGDRGNVIAGWEITKNQIRGIPDAGVGENYGSGEVKLILQSTGSLETSNFVSGLMGWRISSEGNGTAEFENMRIRGTLRTTVFEKESVNVVGGQLMVANSTTIQALKSGSFVIAGAASMSAASTTMSVENVSGFSRGEVLKVKSITDTGFSMEYMTVTGSTRYTESGSAISASLAGYDLTTIDPDGLYGELYVGRAAGQGEVTKSIATTTSESISLLLDNGRPNLGATDIIYVNNTGSLLSQTVIEIGEERMKITAVTGSIPVLGPAGQAQSGSLYVIRDWNDTVPSIHNHGSSVSTINVENEFLAGLVSTAQEYSEGQVIVSTGKFAQGTNFNDAFGYSANTSDAPNANGEYRLKSAAGAHLTTLPTITTATQLEIYNTDRDSTSRDNFYSIFDKNSYIVLLVDGTKEWVRFVVNGNPSKSGNVHTFPIKLNQDFYNAGASTSTTSLNVDFWFMSNIQDVSSGYILMNANPNDLYSPYFDIVERTGSGIYDLQLRARLGDLSGLSSGHLYGDEEPGFGLYTDNGYFKGTIQAMTGSIHGILNIATTAGGIETGDKIMMGRNVQGSNDGIYIDSNNYWLTTGAWKVGGATNYLSLDNGSDGNISIKSETFDLETAGLDIIGSSGTAASNKIRLGNTAVNNDAFAGTSTGIYMDGGGNFRIGNASSTNYFKVSAGGSVLIGTDTFELSATDLDISSTGKTISLGEGNIYLDGGNDLIRVGAHGSQNVQIVGTATQGQIYTGKTSYASTTAGFWLSNNAGTSEFHVGDSAEYIKFDGALSIKSADIDITATNFSLNAGSGKLILENTTPKLQMTTTDAKILLGSATTVDLGEGIFMDGAGNFRMGDATSGGSDYLKFTSSGNLVIKSSDIDITSTSFNLTVGTNLVIDSAGHSISLADGNITLDGTNDGYFEIGTLTDTSTVTGTLRGFRVDGLGNMLLKADDASTNYIKFDVDGGTSALEIKTANFEIVGGNVSMTGTVTAAAGAIGGWTIDSNAIFIGTEVADDTYTAAGGITLGAGFIGSNQFKIAADGDATFKGNLSAPTGTIGGWTIDAAKIYKDNAGFRTHISASKGIGFMSASTSPHGWNNFIEMDSGDNFKSSFAADTYGASDSVSIYSPSYTTDQESGVYHRHYFFSVASYSVSQIAAYEGDISSSVFYVGSTVSQNGTVTWSKNKPTSNLFRIPNPWKQYQNVTANIDFKVRLDYVDGSNVATTAIASGEVALSVEVYDGDDNFMGMFGSTANIPGGLSIVADTTVSFSDFDHTFSPEDTDREWYYKVIVTPKFSYFGNGTNARGVRIYPIVDSFGVASAQQNKVFLNNAGLQVVGGQYQDVRLGGQPQIRGGMEIRKSYGQSGGTLLVRDKMGINHTPSSIFDLTVGEKYYATGSAGSIGASGDIVSSRNIIGYALYNISDKRLKDNITSITGSLDTIEQIRGVEFDWNNKKDNVHDIGFIAQEIEEIPQLNSLVSTQQFVGNETEYKVVSYEKLIPHIVGAIQEQQTHIENLDKFAHEPQNYKEKCDEMEKRIIELEKKLEEL